ncbi:MAG: alpha/beta hydrolase [Flavipsychrobacter sp.]
MSRSLIKISSKYCNNLAYYKQGKGQAVLFIHGFPEDASIWFGVMDKLEDKYTLLAIDLPGVGNSIAALGELSMESMATCIYDVLANEDVETAVIVGHSMGGYVALAFAEFFEDRLQGMSMVHSTASQDTGEKLSNRKKAIAIIEKGGKEIFVKQMVVNLFSKVFVVNNEALINAQIDKALNIKAESLIAFYNAMIKRSDRSDILLNKAFPIQWVMGVDDMVTPSKNTMQHCISANVNFVSLYQDCAHMCMVEKEDELYKDLSAFLEYCYQ